MHFIPITLEAIEPCTTLNEWRRRLDALADVHEMIKVIHEDMIRMYSEQASPLSEDDVKVEKEIKKAHSQVMQMALAKGEIHSFVEQPSTGRFFRIPDLYWKVRLIQLDSWKVCEEYFPCTLIENKDQDELTGQPILLSLKEVDKHVNGFVPIGKMANGNLGRLVPARAQTQSAA